MSKIPSDSATLKNWDDPRVGKVSTDELFAFFDGLLTTMLSGGELSIGWVFILGSRESAKTHNILDFMMRALLAMSEQVVSYVVRKKENQLKRMKKQIFLRLLEEYDFQVRQGVDFKGEPDNTLTFNDNQMIFQTLNDEKVKIDDGGAVGGTTWEQSKYILTFFEEVSQLKRPLYDNFIDTVRGNEKTQTLHMHASNPWDPSHWYCQIFDKHLPADKKALEEKGYQWTIVDYIDGRKALFIRNNVMTNKYVPVHKVKKLQSYKLYNENAYNISFLGLAGVLENTLYANSMKSMLDVDYTFIKSRIGRLQVGIDWGEGKSKYASPTTMHIGRVDEKLGAQIFDEYTHWNNGDGNNRRPLGFNQTQQFDKMISWLIEQWKKFQEPIICYIDMGASIDFNDAINDRLQQYWNIHPSQIYVASADKSMAIEDRVLTLNMMISKGLFRIDKDKCPQLALALMNCRQKEPEYWKEEQKFEREHTWTHWINSGGEYLLGSYMTIWSRGWSEIYQER